MSRLLLLVALAGCTAFPAQQPPAQPEPPPSSPTVAAERHIEINGRPLTSADAAKLERLEQQSGRRAPDGRYWYDDRTGATGTWGGPTIGFLPAGLGFGGPLPAGASGGGDGRLTAVFINGRELHPVDVQGLRAMLGQVVPGRYWVDAMGNAGYEGGPAIMNLHAVARAQGGGDTGRYTKGKIHGDGTYVGKGCAAVNGHLGSTSDSTSYSYFVGCE